jgi:hypothetical protein
MILVAPDAAAGATTAVWHATSTDGGRTFSVPRVVARYNGAGLIGLPALGMTPAGELLLVWGQADHLPDDPWQQARHRLVGIASADGHTWSAPTPLAAAGDPATYMGLPALAATATHWYILVYMATNDATDVVVLRARHGMQRFERWRTLAQRAIGGADIYFHGNYNWFRCEDVVKLGDYVGLACRGSTLAASYTLPVTDDPRSTITAYAAVLDE